MVFFFPIPTKTLFDLPDINILKEPIALSFGVRQLSIGLMITILAISDQTKALSYIMLIGSIVPFVDFIVFIPSIGFASALRHFGPISLILGLGIYLLIKLKEKSTKHNTRSKNIGA